MTDKEVMQQALDALGTCRIMAADMNGNYTKEVTPAVILDAIADLKAAIAQPVQPGRKRSANCGAGYCSCIECHFESKGAAK